MADVVVFHHALGLTPGVRAFADALAADGHRVAAPDLYDGAVFDTLPEGVAHAGSVGFDTVLDRGRLAAENLPDESVYIGFSLGVLPAQMLAQTRPGARAAVLCHACVTPAQFGTSWPDEVAVQIHAMDRDALFVEDGDLQAAHDLVATAAHAELFRYPGEGHLFADPGVPDRDGEAAALLTGRVLDLLHTVDARGR